MPDSPPSNQSNWHCKTLGSSSVGCLHGILDRWPHREHRVWVGSLNTIDPSSDNPTLLVYGYTGRTGTMHAFS
eukprot:1292885-Amphidinium_carterae.3